jgi:four helix bundle protein
LPRAELASRQFSFAHLLTTVKTSNKPATSNGMRDALPVSMTQNDPQGQRSAYESGQDIRDRSFAFACSVVTLSQKLYDDGGVSRLLVAQLIACSTATATMLEEAKAAESDADFISKCCISLKESRESWTRLRICEKCRLGNTREVKDLVQESNELVAIITAIIRNKRTTMKLNRRGRCNRKSF